MSFRKFSISPKVFWGSPGATSRYQARQGVRGALTMLAGWRGTFSVISRNSFPALVGFHCWVLISLILCQQNRFPRVLRGYQHSERDILGQQTKYNAGTFAFDPKEKY